jgi:glycerol-3-phosphate dehydrogenase
MDDGIVTGVGVTGEDGPFEIAAAQVVNATGPWAARWLAEAAPQVPPQTVGLVRSMNLVIDRPGPNVAIAIKSRLESDSRIDHAKRMYFMVPWLGKTVIGTTHHTHDGAIDATPDTAEIASFVTAFNASYPTLDIRPEDVLYCYVGLTPGDDSVDADGAKLHESRVIDHRTAKGLVSIISIKWTTARLVAEQVVDVLATRHAAAGQCQTRTRTVPDFNTMPHDVADLNQHAVKQFVQTHIAHSQVRHLTDIMLRRTTDLILARMTPEQFTGIVAAMTAHFGWSGKTRDQEVRAVLTRLMPSPYRQGITAIFGGVDL